MSDFKKLPTLPDTLKLPAEKDKEAIERFNKLLKDAHEREKLMTRRHLWRNANLPPFSIEPMPYERQRLADGGMTAEQRALRVQWVKDQVLAADEPRWIPELYPKNTFRRWISAPWDALFNKLYPLLVGFSLLNYSCSKSDIKLLKLTFTFCKCVTINSIHA